MTDCPGVLAAACSSIAFFSASLSKRRALNRLCNERGRGAARN
jgi:hypothetical protein